LIPLPAEWCCSWAALLVSLLGIGMHSNFLAEALGWYQREVYATMKTMLIAQIVQVLLTVLPGSVMKRGLDALLDIVEQSVKDSSNRIDDQLLLPLCAKIREELDIPEFGQ